MCNKSQQMNSERMLLQVMQKENVTKKHKKTKKKHIIQNTVSYIMSKQMLKRIKPKLKSLFPNVLLEIRE